MTLVIDAFRKLLMASGWVSRTDQPAGNSVYLAGSSGMAAMVPLLLPLQRSVADFTAAR